MDYKKKCKALKKELKKAKKRLLFSEASIELMRSAFLKDSAKEGAKKSKAVFVGKILSIEGDVVVQKIGRKVSETKEHSLKLLNMQPKVGQVVSIVYGDAGGVVEVI